MSRSRTLSLVCLIIAQVVLSHPASAVIETWDGNTPTGAGDNNFTTGVNWADDTPPAPPGNIATLDLVFGGALKPSPVVNTAYSANSVTFNNTATAFGIVGATLSVGLGGIVNNDTQTMV